MKIKRIAPVLLACTLLVGCAQTDSDGSSFSQTQAPLTAYCSVNLSIGNLPLETDYLPSVVACENGAASYEALKAQAIAARSYAYHAMDNGTVMTVDEHSQVYGCNPTAKHRQAVADTQGIVLQYKGVQLCTFFVAGAIPSNRNTCQPVPGDKDQHQTERHVTYNEGKTGTNVKPSSLGHPANPANRGCMSQNVSDCLSDKGWDYKRILRYFYGEDVEFVQATGACVSPVSGNGVGEEEVIETGNTNPTNACTYATVPNHSEVFHDMANTHWGLGYAVALRAANITFGCNDDPPYFCPECELPRRQAAVFVYRALKLPSSTPAHATFTDVPTSDPNFTEIETLVKEGILSGVGENRFNPDGKLTRAEAATLLVRALKINTDRYLGSPGKQFHDVDKDIWYYPFIQAAVATCIVDGYEDGSFRPQNPVKRIEFAKLLAVAFNIGQYSNCIEKSYECETNNDCGMGKSCSQDHRCIECTTNICANNNQLKKCVNGLYESHSCTYGCFDGACGECISGAKSCSDKQPLICQDGKLMNAGSPCAFGCLQGKCIECETDSDCGNQKRCKNHVCENKPTQGTEDPIINPPGGSTPGGSTPGGSTPGGSTPGGDDDTPSGSTPSGDDDTPSGSTPGGSTPSGSTLGGNEDTPSESKPVNIDDIGVSFADPKSGCSQGQAPLQPLPWILAIFVGGFAWVRRRVFK